MLSIRSEKIVLQNGRHFDKLYFEVELDSLQICLWVGSGGSLKLKCVNKKANGLMIQKLLKKLSFLTQSSFWT